jgi:hypothetical protein
MSRGRTLLIDLLVPASAFVVAGGHRGGRSCAAAGCGQSGSDRSFDERFKDRLRAVIRACEEEDANTETSPGGNQNGDEIGFIPLHAASWYGHVDVARVLLDCGSDVIFYLQC